MARPSKYQPSMAAIAASLCKLGATDNDLAEAFEVSTATIKSWKAKHPEFLASLKAGKDESDQRVERSLYERAVGYTYDAIKHFHHQGKITEVAYKEHVVPDTTAQIFWLKNRRPAEWRDVHHTVNVNTDARGLTREQLEREIAELEARAASEADGSDKSRSVH